MEPTPPSTSADSLVSPGIPASETGWTSLIEASTYENAWCGGSPAHHLGVRSMDCSTSTTPTSECSAYPSFTRSESFLQHQYDPDNGPSLPPGHDCDLPIDPSIPAHSPAYGSDPALSPYSTEMIPTQPPQPRPGQVSKPPFQELPTNASGLTIRIFVPTPGNERSKRTRRNHDQIERIYKCGWDGCDKASLLQVAWQEVQAVDEPHARDHQDNIEQ